MPRTGKGGLREGTPGKAYANRSDLNLPGGTSGHQPGSVRPYGGQGATPPSAVRQSAGGAGPSRSPGRPPAPGPRPRPGLTDPTGRPGEPITSGLEGGGPEPILPQDPYEFLHVLAAKYPNNDDIRRLLGRFS